MGIDFEKKDHIALVGLNIPETKNAFSPDALLDLYRIWTECQEDHDVRVVVLYSALSDIFCSGMDLKTSIPILNGSRTPFTDAEKWLASEEGFGKSLLKYKELDRPVIAAIHGYCITGGFELAMACELRVASEDALFQMREAKLGIMPMSGSNIFLPRQIGATRALEVILTAENFTAAQLYEWGFLNRLVPRDRLMDAALELAGTIAANGPRAVRGMVRLARETRGMSIVDALKREAEIGDPVFKSDDVLEGVRAQKERRKPNFK